MSVFAVEEFLSMLHENDSVVKLYALDMLADSIDNPEVYKKMLQCSMDLNPAIRLKAAQNFGGSSEKKSMLHLLTMLHKETDTRVKATIYKAVAKFKDEKTVPIIAQGLTNTDTRVRANCIEALGTFKDSHNNALIMPYLSDSSPRVRANAAKSLWETEFMIDSVIEENLYSGDEELRQSFAFVVGEIDLKNGMNLLVNMLSDSSPKVRRTAVNSLGKKRNITVIRHLAAMLNTEKNNTIIEEIKAAMLLINPGKSLEYLTNELKNCTDVYKKATLIKAIGYLRCDEGISIITNYMNDTDSRIRANCIEALAYYKDTFLVNIILPFLKDSSARVKANAAGVLWKFGVMNALTALKRMLSEENESVQRSAAYALSRI